MQKPIATALAVGIVLTLGTGLANAGTVVINFDSFTGSGQVPDGYGGITWHNNWNYYDSFQPPYNPSSPSERVYDALDGTPGVTDIFDFQTPTQFDGAWFAGYGFAPVTFYMFDASNNLLATSSTLSPSDTPTFLASGYSGLVTRVQVYSPDPDFFVMDDVTFESPNPVPEPASLTLLGLGALGVIGFGWKRRRPA
jgi:hypothetical protein